MKRVLLSMLAIFTLSLMSFTTPNESVSLDSDGITHSVANDNATVTSEVVWEMFDICSVTVTVTLSDGRSQSATARNNKGNCSAAADAAEARARLKLLMNQPKQ